MSCPHLDKTNVVVGKVVKGLPLIVDMANIPSENDKPLEVSNCVLLLLSAASIEVGNYLGIFIYLYHRLCLLR